MMHSDQATRPPPALLRWAALGAVGLALLGLALLGDLWAQAGAATAPPLVAPPDAVASPTLTSTIFLPLALHHYPCNPLGRVGIAGPQVGSAGAALTFTAAVSPTTATLPIVYTWQATGQSPVVHSAGLSDTVAFTWEVTGAQVLTVTAANDCGPAVSAAHTVDLPWDPRGMIAFERHWAAEDPHDLFVMYNDGARVENLTNTPGDDEGAPAWSPDGNFIAYSSDAVGSGKRAIYKMDLRTRQVTQLTSGEYIDRWPTWSPAGDQIAFMRETEVPPDIYVMDADGANVQQLTDWLYGDDFPAWSPDGEWIAFASDRFYAGRDLWLMRPDGSDQKVVLQTNRPRPDKDRRDEIYPTWSPDGWLYYTFKFKDDPGPKTEQLYRLWPDDPQPEKVFGDEYDRYIASWSPDGRCFVYYSTLGGLAGDDKEIWKWCDGYVSSLNLTNNDIGDEYCAWSPVPEAP